MVYFVLVGSLIEKNKLLADYADDVVCCSEELSDISKELERLEDTRQIHLKEMDNIIAKIKEMDGVCQNQRKLLEIVNEKISGLVLEKSRKIASINFLKLEHEKIRQFIESAVVIEPIVVDRKNKIRNGLVDINRDGLMKLIKIIKKKEKIRNVYMY
jgi:hypothetical protein